MQYFEKANLFIATNSLDLALQQNIFFGIFLEISLVSSTRFDHSSLDCEGISFTFLRNFDVGRLVVICLLLLPVGFAKEGWIVALPELEQAVKSINDNHAVNIDEQHHSCYDAVSQGVFTDGGLHEEPCAECQVDEYVE